MHAYPHRAHRRSGLEVQGPPHGQLWGLQTCGSVWTCPVCAAKIAERRRVELLDAMEMHKAQGGAVSLLTLTTPHQRGDNLAVLLAQQGKALVGFLKDRAVVAVFAEMGWIGQVRALEVTHGRRSDRNNGWHPHFHILQFHQVAGREADRKDWTARLYLRWVAYCEKAGLGTPSYRHGIKLDDGTRASQYVTKWGLEDEMTKGHTKKAKTGGETPFDLLRAYLADGQDSQAAALFREFAECFRGKRQLSWSNGLKARFYVDDKSDEQLAEELEDNAVLLGQITVQQWRDVLKVDGRATVLRSRPALAGRRSPCICRSSTVHPKVFPHSSRGSSGSPRNPYGVGVVL